MGYPRNGSVRGMALEEGRAVAQPRLMTKRSPFRYFRTSPEIIRLAVMMYIRFPLSFRNVEDLPHERGIDVSYESVRFWWQRFGPKFASEIRKRRSQSMRCHSNWKWHLDELLNGEIFYTLREAQILIEEWRKHYNTKRPHNGSVRGM